MRSSGTSNESWKTLPPAMSGSVGERWKLPIQLWGCVNIGPMSDESAFPHPLPPQLAELIAQRFQVLAEPMRIRLLDQLRGGEATVGELQESIGASQQNVSKHLSILHNAGLVTRTKDGNRARYSIADEGVFELCEQVCGGVRRHLAELDQLLRSPSA